MWVAFNAGFGVMMLGAAGCLLAGALVPRWLGWAALVLGIALFSRPGAAEPVAASAA